jgi:tetrapyrrole methylase family protein/MazG family protein
MEAEAIPGVPDGPPPTHHQGERVLDLLRVMARLRGPDGCPWDREQTHQTLARHLLEETHEALEAIDQGDPERLKDELGDLLLQVVFHAEMARQEGAFDADDVAEGIVRKLVRRHPHVFGDVDVSGAAEVLVNWERIKADQEGRDHGVDEEIPSTLPALARAAKVQRLAAGFGFDWRTADAALGKVREELAELEAELRAAGLTRPSSDSAEHEQIEDELGDLLFAVATVGRWAGVDPETALRKATARFGERFDRMRAAAESEGVSLADLPEDELLARFRSDRSTGP